MPLALEEHAPRRLDLRHALVRTARRSRDGRVEVATEEITDDGALVHRIVVRFASAGRATIEAPLLVAPPEGACWPAGRLVPVDVAGATARDGADAGRAAHGHVTIAAAQVIDVARASDGAAVPVARAIERVPRGVVARVSFDVDAEAAYAVDRVIAWQGGEPERGAPSPRPPATIRAEHEAWWRARRAASEIRIDGDARTEEAVSAAAYHLATAARAAPFPARLYAARP